MSAIPFPFLPPSPRPSPRWERERGRKLYLVARGRRVVERLQARLEAAPSDPDGHGPREVERTGIRALRHHRVPHLLERLQARLADAIVDPEIATFRVEPRRLDGGLGRVAEIDHVRNELGNRRDDLAAARGAHREVRLALLEAEGGNHVDEGALARGNGVRTPRLGIEPDHSVLEENARAGRDHARPP